MRAILKAGAAGTRAVPTAETAGHA